MFQSRVLKTLRRFSGYQALTDDRCCVSLISLSCGLLLRCFREGLSGSLCVVWGELSVVSGFKIWVVVGAGFGLLVKGSGMSH